MVTFFIIVKPVVITARKRAQFASTVRVLKDLNKPEDLKHLLGQLPPWITSPEWENGKPFQELLGLLWPALNSTICMALRKVIEGTLKSSADYGHIKFSRFSLGRNSPVICGIKAVPLRKEDMLALVVDLDVRWAGEPDVVLHLTKLSRVSLGLKNLQISSMVRLVFSPIIDEPPFLQRMTVSLLNRPLIDFNLRVLGGPDIMSLPAISSWLNTAIVNITDNFLVWPKEISVPLVPMRHEAPLPTWTSPLGVLVIRVEEATLQKRRSTFLGRWKLPNPRIAIVVPKDDEAGVPQMTLSPVIDKTLKPVWNLSRAFVVTQWSQPLRILLSHRRVEHFLGADMPLGSAEINVEELVQLCENMGGSQRVPGSTKESASCLSFNESPGKVSRRGEDDEFESASSSICASPTKTVSRASSMRDLNRDGDLKTDSSLLDLMRTESFCLESRITETGKLQKQSETNHINAWTPPTRMVPWQDEFQVEGTNGDQLHAMKEQLNRKLNKESGSRWLDILPSPVMTMSGMVAGALQPNTATRPTQFESGVVDSNGTWLQSLRNFMMPSAFAEDVDFNEASSTIYEGTLNGEGGAPHPDSAARVKVSFRWIPINDASEEQLSSTRVDNSNKISKENNCEPSTPNFEASKAFGSATSENCGELEREPSLPTHQMPYPLADERLLQFLELKDSGVLGIRVSFTKIDYGDNPANPVLSFGQVPSSSSLGPTTASHGPNIYHVMDERNIQRVISMDCQPGARPGVLHWGQIFHLPVSRATESRIRVELGNASSSLKLSSYGADLFLLDANSPSFNEGISVEATAFIPLRDVISHRTVDRNYTLREAKTERMAGINDEQRLDIGRIVLSLSWFPFTE